MIITKETRETAAYFGEFIDAKMIDLKTIRHLANLISELDNRPAPPMVYNYSDSLVAHLSETFRSTSFPDGFTSPSRFVETVKFFQIWLNETVSAALEDEKRLRPSELADRLLKFIRDFDDAAQFVFEHIPLAQVPPETITSIIKKMEMAFPHIHNSLQHRYDNRSTITITDEYDVQDLYCSVLRVFVPDIRLEEPIPSNGGKRSRADVLLHDYETIIEFKKTRAKSTDSAITEQLIIDCALYQAHPHCKYIHFFIFDPDRHIRNEVSIQKTLIGKHKSGDASKPVVVSCVIVR